MTKSARCDVLIMGVQPSVAFGRRRGKFARQQRVTVTYLCTISVPLTGSRPRVSVRRSAGLCFMVHFVVKPLCSFITGCFPVPERGDFSQYPTGKMCAASLTQVCKSPHGRPSSPVKKFKPVYRSTLSCSDG